MRPLWPVLLTLLITPVGAEEPAPAGLTLREAVTVDTPELTLGQIAEVQLAGDLQAQVSSLDLGPAPPPGSPRVVDRGYLKLRLRRAGIDPATLAFSGAERTLVSRAGPPLAVPPPAVAVPGLPAAPVETTPPVPVPYGATVLVTVRCGGVEVRAEGRLQNRAAVGERVSVRITGTSKLVEGLLLSPAEVEVLPQ